MNRPLLFFVLALGCAGTASAADGTRVLITTKALSLPPGTRVHVEMSAQFTFTMLPEVVAPKPGAGPTHVEITDDMIKYRLDAAKPLVWEFIVPPGGKVPEEHFELVFSKLLPAPPKGMFASIGFPTHYRCVVPGAKAPLVIERTNEFGMAYERPTAVITRCIRFASSGPEQFGMGVLPSCDVDPRKLPGARVLPQ